MNFRERNTPFVSPSSTPNSSPPMHVCIFHFLFPLSRGSPPFLGQEPRVVGEKRPLQALIRSKGAPLRQYADRLNEGESELSRNSLAEELDALAENEKNVLRIQELKEEIGKYKSRVIGLQDENQQLMLLVKDKSKQIVRESTMISKRELLAMKENIQFAIDQLKKDKQEFNQLKVKKKPLSSSVPAPSVPTGIYFSTFFSFFPTS